MEQQQQYINNLETIIRNDNRQRDHNLALLKSFVTENVSNHPNDYEDFVNHQSSQSINNSIVPIQGGKRKTRKRKTRRKKGGTGPDGRRSNRVYPQPTENENITYIEPNRRGRETLWREHKVNIRDLPRARVVRTRELPLAQEVVVGKVRETPRQHMINLAKKCKNKFDNACRTVKRIAGRELSGSGSRKKKKQNKKQTKRRSRTLRKTIKKKKKGGEYSELAKNTIRKNASRYPKLFHSTIEKTNPSKLIRKRTPKVYPRKGPGIGGKRKTKRRKTIRKRK